MRGKAIRAVLSLYECVLSSVEEMGSSGSNTGIKCLRTTIHGKRSEDRFHEVFQKAVAMVNSLGVEPILIPHQRKSPKRYTSEVSQHTP